MKSTHWHRCISGWKKREKYSGWCSTPNQLLICSSFSREYGHPLLICSSLSTSQYFFWTQRHGGGCFKWLSFSIVLGEAAVDFRCWGLSFCKVKGGNFEGWKPKVSPKIRPCTKTMAGAGGRNTVIWTFLASKELQFIGYIFGLPPTQ